MVIEVSKFTGVESSVEINYFNNQGEWFKTHILENLEIDLIVNTHGNNQVKLKTYFCSLFDDSCNGSPIDLNRHQVYYIEKELTNLIDWDSWQMQQDKDINDFMNFQNEH
jgi:hypothetical protein